MTSRHPMPVASPFSRGGAVPPARSRAGRADGWRRRRWRWLWGVGALAGTVAAGLLLAGGDRPDPGPSCNPLADGAVSGLTVFTSWLAEYHVAGVIGEVGWPSSPTDDWASVAGPWVNAALGRGVGLYVWGAAQNWAPTYPLAVYRNSPTGELVAGTQSRLVEHVSASLGAGVTALRGVALSGPSFGAALDGSTSSYSSRHPGVRGIDYSYPSRGFLVQLSQRGIRSVRLAVMWERLQPRPFGPLAPGEMGELRRVLRDASELGMSVVIDLHNYGRYAEGSASGARRVLRVGSVALPASSLADLWRRVARELRGSPALAAYGLMNEPHDLPGGSPGWEETTREVVAAIREVDPSTLVLVPGYGWSAATHWRENHPRPWVQGPGVAYEAHQYFDHDGSGRYLLPIDEENALAKRASCPSSSHRS